MFFIASSLSGARRAEELGRHAGLGDLDRKLGRAFLCENAGDSSAGSGTQSLQNLYVLRLPALGAALDVEANRLAFLQTAEAVRLDRREVHEHVFAVLP